MSPTAPALTLLVGLALGLLTLFWFSRQISACVQQLIYRPTQSADAATIGLFLLFLPGVLVHELAHWVVAWLLGLKPSRFRVWPQRRGRMIQLGQVTVRQGGIWLDSLVGLAPLIAGTALIALIGHRVFEAYRLAEAFIGGDWIGLAELFRAALHRPDATLWTYAVFALANAMMPSPSDREPVKPVLLYLAAAAVFYMVLDLPLDLFHSLLEAAGPLLASLNGAILFTILLDTLVLAALVALDLFLDLFTRRTDVAV